MIGKLFKALSPNNNKTESHSQKSSANNPSSTDNDKPRGKKAPRKRQSHKRSAAPAPAAPWSLDNFEVPVVEGKTRFHDLGLDATIMRGIHDLGFEYCSPIQAQSLPHVLNGLDIVGKAQTGTGKTAAFLLGMIHDLLNNPLEERYAGEARALILAPTRELVIQIAEDATALCKHTDLKVHTLVGGMDYAKQQRKVQSEFVDILVATPGRLLDFCSNGDVYLDRVELLVIDEADRMLDMGFIPQVRRIIRMTPRRENRQTLLFSATFTDEVISLSEQWTLDPVRIEIEPESVATDTVEQHIYLASSEEKFPMLYNLLQQPQVDSLIVFANRRDECRRLHETLLAYDIKAGLLSGEIAQNKRVKTLDDFKSGRIKVLVATDVAGRGIHIDGISHVVNFTLPDEPEDYVHRIGRTGRAGTSGTSISFACEDDAFRLMPIQELVGNNLSCEQPPESLLAPVAHRHVKHAPRQRQSNSNSSSRRPNHSRRR